MEKLRQRGFDRSEINPVLAECSRLDYLDDGRFARAFALQLRRKGYGPYHIRQMLHAKGVTESVIHTAISESCKECDVISDCRELLAKKVSQQSDNFSTQRMKQRLHRFLLQRGFPADVVSNAIEDFFSSRSSHP